MSASFVRARVSSQIPSVLYNTSISFQCPGHRCYLAAWSGDGQRVTELLQDPGVDVNVKDEDDGMTPAHFAAMTDDSSVLELLVANGADLEAKDNAGKTAAHWAVMGGHRSVVEFLIAKGADFEAKDNDGKTSAHWAAAHSHFPVLELLVANGADLEAKDNDGKTPAHCAATNGHCPVVEFLVAKGADLDAQDNDGKVPSGVALDMEHTVVVQLLSAALRSQLRDTKRQLGLSIAETAGLRMELAVLRQQLLETQSPEATENEDVEEWSTFEQ